jgi:L-lactate dehydrogenase complex protein LldG
MPEGVSAARAAILDRIRSANSATDPGVCREEYETIARTYQQSATMDRAAILKTFAERLREYDARVHSATSVTVGTTIGEVFGTRGQRSVVVVAKGFPQQWIPDSLSWKPEADADIEVLNNTEGAIVTCEIAIAHTGTIVLRGSRKMTLLPDRLLCVVGEDQVVETVPEAIAHLQPFAADPLTFISGPSATADIEMTRIRGVHGPRFLEVVLVEN